MPASTITIPLWVEGSVQATRLRWDTILWEMILLVSTPLCQILIPWSYVMVVGGGHGTHTAGMYEPDSFLSHARLDLKLRNNVI